MAYLIPSDKGTHFVVGAAITVPLLPAGLWWALGVCFVVAVGREVYGRRQRGRRMERADWIESLADIGATMAACDVVLAAALIGV